jgi:hypothetical protein
MKIEDLYKEPTWTDTKVFDDIFLTWQLNNGLGVLAIQNVTDLEPTVVFCSLFPDAKETFYQGMDATQFGLKLSDLRKAVDRIEREFKDRGFPQGQDVG